MDASRPARLGTAGVVWRRLDRFEAYVSLLFSGARLALFCILLVGPSVLVAGRQVPIAVGIAAALLGLLLVTAEGLLIRAIERSVRTDTPHVALTIAADVRSWPCWLRVPMAAAYAMAALLTFLAGGGAFAGGETSAGRSLLATTTLAFTIMLAFSYSANLALTAAMSAVRLPERLITTAFRHRLLIDATVAAVASVVLGTLARR